MKREHLIYDGGKSQFEVESLKKLEVKQSYKMLGIIKKIFGTAQSRQIKKYQKIVKQINALETEYQSLSEHAIKEKVPALKARFKQGESLDSLLPEAYALVKNTCRRLHGIEVHVSGYNQKWDMIPYDVQLLGGIALHFGSIAEMGTGEGKTLTASMPLFLNALSEKPVHLVTVNDYLAHRDCQWIGAIFTYLGLSVKALTNGVPPDKKKEIYEADIVYGTASEFGFDYLRDNSMARSHEDQCQRGYFYAIIDEVDSILIDEARTPLIISGPASTSSQLYAELKDPVERIIRIQRNHCNELASEARKILDALGRLNENEPLEKLDKKEQEKEEKAFRKLWLVSKGTPQNKILKRMKEHPDLRAEIEKWETYFFSEANKKERHQTLAELHIIVDEKANEFELTDKGIQAWSGGDKEKEDDFTMLDLGHEYGKIDADSSLSDQEKMEKKIQVRDADSKRKERAHNLRQLFRAHLLMEKDVDYIVQDKKIVIIDENTGRAQPGRRFSDGLHQSIEAKERVPIQKETQTYATITLQNYFRLYEKLGGMTGTAMTEASEFKEIYNLETLEIPPHKKCQRKDANDEVYMTEREKYQAILKNIQASHDKGRPVLIGTESVETSEKLSRILKQNKQAHTVLNAKNHEREAEIIAEAGQKGAITVATNMAGRGTDIKLGEGVAELGGLHVIGTTRHQSRRIDRQLRGRCARQGDPGTSHFYVSFEDQLMRLFASPKITTFLKRFRPPEGEAISASVLNKSIETAQRRIEQRNYSVRKHTLEYDDVMNRQRKEIYAFRNDILKSKARIKIAEEILEEVCMQFSDQFLFSSSQSETLNPKPFCDALMEQFPITFTKREYDIDNGNDLLPPPYKEPTFSREQAKAEDIETEAIEQVKSAFRQKIQREIDAISAAQEKAHQKIDPHAVLEHVVHSILLTNIDRMWQEHLLLIDHLRTDVNLRVIGQKDPLMEFKHEAFELFERFSKELKLKIGNDLFKFTLVHKEPEPDLLRPPKKRKDLGRKQEQNHSGVYLKKS